MAEEIILEKKSIKNLFLDNKNEKYIVPIYQRNFAWENDEIATLIRDVYEAYRAKVPSYYIGTLVTYPIDNQGYEVIDGQQRLTAIYLILSACLERCDDILYYETRKKTSDTLSIISEIVRNLGAEKFEKNFINTLHSLQSLIPDNTNGSYDKSILTGFQSVINSILNINDKNEINGFLNFFKTQVFIIRYKVPKGTDLNQYFEIMNSRGEQLEQHEAVKARLMNCLKIEEDKAIFSQIWDACSCMGTYTQSVFYKEDNALDNRIEKAKMKLRNITNSSNTMLAESLKQYDESKNKQDNETFRIFDEDFKWYTSKNEGNLFEALNIRYNAKRLLDSDDKKQHTSSQIDKSASIDYMSEQLDTNIQPTEHSQIEDTKDFRPIIDFSNFLLIVLKITMRLKNDDIKISLDDKKVYEQFNGVLDKIGSDSDKNERACKKESWVKVFAYNLLKAKFFLDNYIVHQSKEDNKKKDDSEPTWELKVWSIKPDNDSSSPQQKEDSKPNEDELVQLLSMFEVTYSSRQHKDYLLYCLYYLIHICNSDEDSTKPIDLKEYHEFLETLAKIYFYNFYLSDKRDSISGVIDNIIFKCEDFNALSASKKTIDECKSLFGKEDDEHTNIPAFIFNYLDYKIWSEYLKGNKDRKKFFDRLGCKDFGLDNFRGFYFSRTRDSLEHYFPAANVKTEKNPDSDDNTPNDTDDNVPNEIQANCFGNFAMIGRNINSSGSNWDPQTKLVLYYKDRSKKIPKTSVASLKFQIMMQICENEGTWGWKQIREHQGKMLNILFDIPEKQDDSKKS